MKNDYGRTGDQDRHFSYGRDAHRSGKDSKNPMRGAARRTYDIPAAQRADGDAQKNGDRGGNREYGNRDSFGSRENREGRPGGREYGERGGFASRENRGGQHGGNREYGERGGFGSRESREGRPGGREYGSRDSFGSRESREGHTYRGNASRPPRVGAIYDNVPIPERVDAPVPAVPVPPAIPDMENPEENESLLVGRNPIREAIRSGRRVEKLLVAQGDLSGAARDIIRMARDAGAVIQTVDRGRLDQIYPAHQGMLAYVAAVEYKTIDDMFALAAERGEDPFLILLDGVTDPHNVGAIIRSAECAGAHGVILPERRAAGLGPAAAKAAAGALSYLPIAREKNLNRTIDELKARGVWVIGTAMDGEDALSADLTGPVALVIGSEGDGISRLTLEKCDRTLTLPMKGRIESLNASVAAGILMYAVLRARRT